MSRIGVQPIPVPSGVNLTIDEATNEVVVKGPKGELRQILSRLITFKQEDGNIVLTRANDLREARSQHGLSRTLIANMIQGVTKGHEKLLDIQGVGYRAQMEGRGLILNMGFSHPVRVAAPEGITFEIKADDKARTQAIVVSGIDKALVGQLAADVRKV
ncbi:MAG: 50S ribosomal protein L6, partial [Armatimonadota bacterium]